MWRRNKKKKKGNPIDIKTGEEIIKELDEKDVEWLMDNVELSGKDIRRLEQYARQRS